MAATYSYAGSTRSGGGALGVTLVRSAMDRLPPSQLVLIDRSLAAQLVRLMRSVSNSLQMATLRYIVVTASPLRVVIRNDDPTLPARW
ncbi:MAG: hypothetical protein ACRD6N_05150, partial [Pyrinomonadaceae bacterium]